MRFIEVIWHQRFAEKIRSKHHLELDEVEQVLINRPFVRRLEKGRRAGENLYAAYGRTTGGKYVIVFVIDKGEGAAMPISARLMTSAERRCYGKRQQ